MNDFRISTKYAHATRSAPKDFSGVRAYRASPFSVSLQVFTNTTRQALISTCNLNAEECRALATELHLLADTLSATQGGTE